MTAIRDANTMAEVATVADLIARSFDRLAANHHLVPDPARRLPIMRGWFRLHAEHAFQVGVGRVMVTDDLTAAAIWYRRTIPFTPPADYDRHLAELAGPHLSRFHDLDLLLEAHHPTDWHWHLAFLAVEPDQQGHGLGSALLEHTLGWLDHHHKPTYLEATNDDNQRLYARHGFRDHGDPIRFGDGTFYPMWRPADASGSTNTPAVETRAQR